MPALRHGDRGKRLYRIWKNMRQRCFNPNCPAYPAYGGRGISACKEWDDYLTFKEWALKNGYCDNLTLDRINNNLGYSPENCRWATIKEQSNNTRTNRVLSFNGQNRTMSQWAETLGVCVATLWDRLDNGWSVERTLTEPIHNNGSNRSQPPNCGAKMKEALCE